MTTVHPFHTSTVSTFFSLDGLSNCRLFFHWWRLIFALEIVDVFAPHHELQQKSLLEQKGFGRQRGNISNMFTQSFYSLRYQKCKRTVKSSVHFYAFGIWICGIKSCFKTLVKSTPNGYEETIIVNSENFVQSELSYRVFGQFGHS